MSDFDFPCRRDVIARFDIEAPRSSKRTGDALSAALECAPIDLSDVAHLPEEAEAALSILERLALGARPSDFDSKASQINGRCIYAIAVGTRFRLHVDAKTYDPLRLVSHQPFHRQPVRGGVKDQKRRADAREDAQRAALREKIAAAPIDLKLLEHLPVQAERALDLIARIANGAHPSKLGGKQLEEWWNRPYSVPIGLRFRLIVDHASFKPLCVMSHEDYNKPARS